MTTPAQDIATVLEAALPGLVFATNLFVGTLPVSPDNVMAVIDSGGAAADAAGYRELFLAILVRNRDYVTGWGRAEAARATLHQSVQQEIDGTRYAGAWQQTDIIALGTDDLGRFLFSLNFRVQRGA